MKYKYMSDQRPEGPLCSPLRCQVKCDKGSQCTRLADHDDGYHLTEHGCVCLTEDTREHVVTFQGVVLEPASGEMVRVPPAHPSTISQDDVEGQEKSATADEDVR